MPASLPTASQPTVTIYTKTAWADSWAEQPLAVGLQMVLQAAPSHPSATIAWRYGVGMLPEIGSRAADSAVATIARGAQIGKYIRINVSGLGDWYGVILDNTDHRAGELTGAVPSGVEVYTCFGLTWFLDQTPITQTKVKHSGGTWLIDRVIPFNGGTDSAMKRANRVSWRNYDETAKCFTDRTQTTAPKAWRAKHAAEYVLENFAPRNAAGSVLLPFGLDSTAADFLDYELGTIDYANQTPWQLLNQIIDRRRGLGWHLILDAGTLKVKVWSQTDVDITLPSGSVIPENADQTTYNFDTAVNIEDASVSTTLMSRYDQVIVRGERAGSVFTVRPQTNFEPDWTTADKNAYNAGASAKTGYSTLADSDKEAANSDVRASDKLAKVFSWWRPKTTWNGRAAMDPATGTGPFCFPKIDVDGEDDTETAANIQRAGLRVLPYLPMRQGVDYTLAITPDRELDDENETDFLPPMLFLKGLPIRTAVTSDGGWIHCERLAQAVEANSSRRPYTYSVELAVREDAPGIILRTVGKPQHYIAQDQYSPQGSFENITGEGINHDQWIATIYMLQDAFCRAQFPLQADVPSLDLVRQLLIDVAGAHLDYLVPGTIVAVDSGELKKSASGGYLRDDRDKLRDLARMAFAWYGQQRRILHLSFKGITTGFDIGTLITKIGSGANEETINTCITSVVYDLQAGTTQLHTQFGEVDFRL